MINKTMASDSSNGVLVIDDDAGVCDMLTLILNDAGYKTYVANRGNAGIALFHGKSPDAVILDLRMPGMDGIDVLKQLKQANSETPVIIITAYGKIQSVVDAMKHGAYDYITKPFVNEEIVLTIQRAIKQRSMQQEIHTLKTQLNLALPLFEQMGSGDEIVKIYKQIERVAPTSYTVIIYGETGSGKELVARDIHNRSPRKDKPFVVVDCGSIPETLIESELFGYEKGAFTGADQRKAGQFEMVNGGTLFLDEIGNLPKSMQGKLLRVLQERRIRRLGGNKEIDVDLRVIAAGNERLESLVVSRHFRMDLYQRLNEFHIEIPPLQQRKDDIIFLSKRFLDITNKELNKNISGITKEALGLLMAYHWPGNVRELKNVIRRAALLAEDKIDTGHLPVNVLEPGRGPEDVSKQTGKAPDQKTGQTMLLDFDINAGKGASFHDVIAQCVESAEKKVLTETLKQTHGNKRLAAKILKIDYKTIFYKCRKYGIEADNFKLEA